MTKTSDEKETAALSDDYRAGEGQVWVCKACGRRARDRDEGGIDPDWDASCSLHAVLCEASSLVLRPDGKVQSAKVVRT